VPHFRKPWGIGSKISGLLRLSAPPSISDTMLEPLVRAFQASYPDVRIKIFVTDRLTEVRTLALTGV
jgi:DNA-binding transcriptional LysR family regulator